MLYPWHDLKHRTKTNRANIVTAVNSFQVNSEKIIYMLIYKIANYNICIKIYIKLLTTNAFHFHVKLIFFSFQVKQHTLLCHKSNLRPQLIFVSLNFLCSLILQILNRCKEEESFILKSPHCSSILWIPSYNIAVISSLLDIYTTANFLNNFLIYNFFSELLR